MSSLLKSQAWILNIVAEFEIAIQDYLLARVRLLICRVSNVESRTIAVFRTSRIFTQLDNTESGNTWGGKRTSTFAKLATSYLINRNQSSGCCWRGTV